MKIIAQDLVIILFLFFVFAIIDRLVLYQTILLTFKLHTLIDYFSFNLFSSFFFFSSLFIFVRDADFSNIHWLQPHQPCLIYRVLIIVRTMKTNQVQQPYQQSQRPRRMWASVRSVHRIKSIKFIIQMVAHRLYMNITKCRIKIIFNGRKYLFQCLSWWVFFSLDQATSYINFQLNGSDTMHA